MNNKLLKTPFSVILPSLFYLSANIILTKILPFENRNNLACCILSIPLIFLMVSEGKIHISQAKIRISELFPFVGLIASVAFLSGAPEKITSVAEFVAIIFAGPVSEEIIYRVITLNQCKKIMNPLPAVLTSSLLFAAGHGQLTNITVIFAFGILLSAIYLKTNSFVLIAILHIVVNFTLCFEMTYNLPILFYVIGIIYFIYSITFIILNIRNNNIY